MYSLVREIKIITTCTMENIYGITKIQRNQEKEKNMQMQIKIYFSLFRSRLSTAA